MADVSPTGQRTAPLWVRIVSIIGIFWYLFGFTRLLKNLTMDVAGAVANGTITAAHGDAITTTPFLIWACYFFACLLGLIGAALFFRDHWSSWKCFALALILDVIYFGWFYVSDTASARPREAGIIAIIVIGMAIVFTGLSFFRRNTRTTRIKET